MPVVYDGVAGDAKGDLFKGLKIWISHRVPLRSKWVDLVKGNGGEVTQLDTSANMKIADHIKRGGMVPPPGSYSYQWIEFSVRNGQLENKDDYEIGQPQTSRPIASDQQTKTTRTKFSVKDDLILTKWVLTREWKGEASGGNEVYKDLERQYPNHTWQSWRDRWVKKLKDRPRPSITPESLEPEIEQEACNTTASAATPYKQAETSHESEASRRTSPPAGPSDPGRSIAQPIHSPDQKQPLTRNRRLFTEEEDDMLRAFIHEARDRGEPLGGNLIYQQFAAEHPSRSFHSWRDRWLRHLSQREANLDNVGQRRNSREQNVAQADRKVVKPQSSPATKPGPGSSPLKQRINSKSDDQRLKRQEDIRRRLRAVKTLQRRWRGYAVRRDRATLEAAVVPLQSIMRGYLARRDAAILRNESQNADQALADGDLIAYYQRHEDYSDGSEDEGISSIGPMPEISRDPKDQFYSDLQAYAEEAEVDINYNPTIQGVRIDLWDLFRVATKYEPEVRDMKRVAAELKLDWRRRPGVLDDLQQVYQENLAEFEAMMKAFADQEFGDDVLSEDAEQVGDSQNEKLLGPQKHEGSENAYLPQTSDVMMALNEPAIEQSSPGYRSSPPVAGSKRSRRYTELLTSDPGYPSEGSRKRRRLDKNTVIPPTPEGKLSGPEKEARNGSVQNYTSPLKSRGNNSVQAIHISSDEESGLFVDQDEDEDEDGGQQELPSYSNGLKPKHLEPETQDWAFGPPGNSQQLAIYASVEVDDVSPSQQLRRESRDHDRLDRQTPSRLSTDTRVKHTRSSASAVQKASGQSAGGPRRSIVPQTAAQPPFNGASRPVVGTKSKRRTLPSEYSQGTAPSANQREAVSLAGSNPTFQPPRRAQVPTTSPALPPAAGTRVTNRPVAALPTRLTSSVRSTPQRSQKTFDDAYVQAQIDHFEALGYKPAHIAEAMWAASCQRGPQNVALESLHKGLGLPQNEPGIWTAKDDADLKMVQDYDQGKMPAKTKVKVWNMRNRLTEKHGEEGIKKRLELHDLDQERNKKKDVKGKGRAV